MSNLGKTIALAAALGGGGGTPVDYNSLSNKPQINGVTLTGDKSADSLLLQENEASLRQKFVAEYGEINLLDNPLSDWWSFIIGKTGVQEHLYAPYGNTMMVEVWVDKDKPYPIIWNNAGKWYGRNSEGFKEIVPNGELVVSRDDLSEAVLKILDQELFDGGSF